MFGVRVQGPFRLIGVLGIIWFIGCVGLQGLQGSEGLGLRVSVSRFGLGVYWVYG